MPYPPEIVEPMRDELRRAGFEELRTPEDVDRVLCTPSEEPVLVVVNSICGCAAGVARPGVTRSLADSAAPRRRATVFAGQDVEATARARSYFEGNAPSSPQVAILAKGRLLYLMQRQQIEGRTPEQVEKDLRAAYQKVAATVPGG
jgi:putative YphP/YqiW family bacilliredoxin